MYIHDWNLFPFARITTKWASMYSAQLANLYKFAKARSLAMIIIETTVVFLLPCLIEINYKITIFGADRSRYLPV